MHPACTPFDPWTRLVGQVNRLQQEVVRRHPLLGSRWGQEFPAVNLRLDAEAAHLDAELPGVTLDHLDLSVNGRVVTLKGTRPSRAPENAEFQRRECPAGAFARAFELPFQVDADHIEATLTHGVLRVRLPRAESDKPRKITVRTPS